MLGNNRIGVFGGTFDPVHVGHLIIAEVMRHRLALSHVVFLPAGRPPHKPTQDLASNTDRVNMLRLSIADSAHFSVSTIDIVRDGPSFTADSLQLLHAELEQHTEMYFLMGQDSLRDFPNWRRPESIARQARLGVARRPGVDVSVDDVIEAVPELNGRVEFIEVPLIDISSRQIREAIRTGGPFRFQVVAGVADYIAEHRLYFEHAITNGSHPVAPD